VTTWAFFLIMAAADAETPAATTKPLIEPDRGWHGDLSITQEYRLRTAQPGAAATAEVLGEATAATPRRDQDLRFALESQGWGLRDHLRGQMSSALWLSLEGRRSLGQPDLFGEVSDYRQPLWVIYSLSAEWRHSLPLEHLRLGRQTSEHGPPITFDGGSVGLRLWERKLSLFGYAGRTVHFFESQPGLLDYWVACAGATFWATENTRLEIDSRLERDGILSREAQQLDFLYVNSYGLSLSTRFSESWAKLYARGLDRKPSRAGGALHLASSELSAGLDAQVNAQLRTLGEISENENPFYSILGPSQPNLRARLELWKGLALGPLTVADLRLGWRMRQLLSGSEGPFNRNGGGVYFQAAIDNLGVKGLFLSGIAEWNYVPWSLSRDSYLAFGGSAGYNARRFKVESGTYYQQWKVTLYRDAEELQNARTLFGLASVRPLAWFELRARYTVEIVDRMIQSVFLSLREDF
jgi:hypothetical protein